MYIYIYTCINVYIYRSLVFVYRDKMCEPGAPFKVHNMRPIYTQTRAHTHTHTHKSAHLLIPFSISFFI